MDSPTTRHVDHCREKGLLSENKCKGMNGSEAFSNHIIKDTASRPAQEKQFAFRNSVCHKVVYLVRGSA